MLKVDTKKLVNNPVYKVVKLEKNPFVVLPLYENLDVYETFKHELAKVHRDCNDLIYEWSSEKTLPRMLRERLEKIKNMLIVMSNIDKSISKYIACLEDDEIVTYELL